MTTTQVHPFPTQVTSTQAASVEKKPVESVYPVIIRGRVFIVWAQSAAQARALAARKGEV